MAAFNFIVEDAFTLQRGGSRVTLVGQAEDQDGTLRVGDLLDVPTADGGLASCECVDFPLVNLGADRAAWIRVTVVGVSVDRVKVGGRAERK